MLSAATFLFSFEMYTVYLHHQFKKLVKANYTPSPLFFCVAFWNAVKFLSLSLFLSICLSLSLWMSLSLSVSFPHPHISDRDSCS